MKKNLIVILSVVLVVFLISFTLVSAGWFSNLISGSVAKDTPIRQPFSKCSTDIDCSKNWFNKKCAISVKNSGKTIMGDTKCITSSSLKNSKIWISLSEVVENNNILLGSTDDVEIKGDLTIWFTETPTTST